MWARPWQSLSQKIGNLKAGHRASTSSSSSPSIHTGRLSQDSVMEICDQAESAHTHTHTHTHTQRDTHSTQEYRHMHEHFIDTHIHTHRFTDTGYSHTESHLQSMGTRGHRACPPEPKFICSCANLSGTPTVYRGLLCPWRNCQGWTQRLLFCQGDGQ
jgi:hypothetical protein